MMCLHSLFWKFVLLCILTESTLIEYLNKLFYIITKWKIIFLYLENYHTEIVECEEDQKQFESDFNKTCIRIESLSGTLFYYNKLQNLNMNCSHRGPVFCYSEKQLEGCIYVEGGYCVLLSDTDYILIKIV